MLSILLARIRETRSILALFGLIIIRLFSIYSFFLLKHLLLHHVYLCAQFTWSLHFWICLSCSYILWVCCCHPPPLLYRPSGKKAQWCMNEWMCAYHIMPLGNALPLTSSSHCHCVYIMTLFVYVSPCPFIMLCCSTWWEPKTSIIPRFHMSITLAPS